MLALSRINIVLHYYFCTSCHFDISGSTIICYLISTQWGEISAPPWQIRGRRHLISIWTDCPDWFYSMLYKQYDQFTRIESITNVSYISILIWQHGIPFNRNIHNSLISRMKKNDASDGEYMHQVAFLSWTILYARGQA